MGDTDRRSVTPPYGPGFEVAPLPASATASIAAQRATLDGEDRELFDQLQAAIERGDDTEAERILAERQRRITARTA